MENIKFEGCNVEIAKNQKEYKTLQAFQDEQVTITCYRLSFLERIKLLFTGKLWLGQMNFGTPLQPQLPTVDMSDLLVVESSRNINSKRNGE